MRWIWRGFCAGVPGDAACGIRRSTATTAARCGWPGAAHAGRPRPSCSPAADLSPGVARRPSPDHQQPELALGAVPAPRALPVSRLSYSRPRGLPALLATASTCERALRLRAGRSRRCAPEHAGRAGLGALLRGTLVHELLERLDFQRPRGARRGRGGGASSATARAGARRGRGGPARRWWRASPAPSCARASPRRARVRSELPFAFTLDAARGPAGAACWSTAWWTCYADRGRRRAGGGLQERRASDGRDPEELCARAYATQRLVYALAGAAGGAERVEVVHCFLERPDEPASRSTRPRTRTRLEARAARAGRAGSWRAASSPPPSRTASCAATARGGPRCAPGTSSTRCQQRRS